MVNGTVNGDHRPYSIALFRRLDRAWRLRVQIAEDQNLKVFTFHFPTLGPRLSSLERSQRAGREHSFQRNSDL